MTDEIAAGNRKLVRRFYKEVYVDWNMALVDKFGTYWIVNGERIPF